jgi:NADH-quinone oxidoreductase subunit F
MKQGVLLDTTEPLDLEGYRARGGYEALARAVREWTPARVIEEVKRAGLRGRGGAGFIAGKKWEMAAAKRGAVKYLCVNGSEGEPGTEKDRSLIRLNPHQLIEGAALAAYAIGATHVYIFLKARFTEEFHRLVRAVEEAKAARLIGPDPGALLPIDVEPFRGPDAYIAGEETAMIEAIEGRMPRPRQKPPFYPIQHGLHGKPTLVNNAETLYNVPLIISRGAEWYQQYGTPTSPGTMLFTLSGDVERPGVYELELGTPLRTLLNDCGGGVKDGRPLKAIFPGGPSHALLTEKQLDVPLDFDSLKTIGSSLGTAGVMVYNDRACMVAVALRFASFYADGSCRQCPPCYMGTAQIRDLLQAVEEGRGTGKEVARIKQICNLIRGRGYCDLINSAVRSVESVLHYFTPEFEAHVSQRCCPLNPASERSPRL